MIRHELSKRWVFVFILTITLYACYGPNDSSRKHTISQLSWLEGTWIGEQDSITFIEHWKAADSILFRGTGIWIKENDTLSQERLSIEFKNDKLYYVADVSGNENKIPFELVYLKPNTVCFRNEANEFPKFITYIFNEPSNLYIRIEDKPNSTGNFQEFYLKKKLTP